MRNTVLPRAFSLSRSSRAPTSHGTPGHIASVMAEWCYGVVRLKGPKNPCAESHGELWGQERLRLLGELSVAIPFAPLHAENYERSYKWK